MEHGISGATHGRRGGARSVMAGLLRLADGLDRLNGSVAAMVRWGLLANALLIAFNAIGRKLFAVGWVLAYDMQWHFLAAVVLLMAAHTFKRDQHVRIDLFAHRLGERGMAWLDLAGILCVLLPVCITMVWVSFPQFWTSFAAAETRASRESLSTLPAWIIKGFIPAGFLLLGLQGLAEGFRCVAALTRYARRPIHRDQLIGRSGRG